MLYGSKILYLKIFPIFVGQNRDIIVAFVSYDFNHKFTHKLNIRIIFVMCPFLSGSMIFWRRCGAIYRYDSPFYD